MSKKQTELIATVDRGAMAAHLKEIEQEIDHLQGLISDMPERVQDDDDYTAAAGALIRVVGRRKIVEEEKKRITAKIAELVAAVEESYGPRLEKIADVEGWFRRAMTDYALACDAHAHGLRLAAGKLPAKDEGKSIALLEQANDSVPPKVSGIALVPRARAEIVNEERLPEWAWKRVVDMKTIEAKLVAGEQVPGARAVMEISLRVTPKNAKGGEA